MNPKLKKLLPEGIRIGSIFRFGTGDLFELFAFGGKGIYFGHPVQTNRARIATYLDDSQMRTMPPLELVSA